MSNVGYLDCVGGVAGDMLLATLLDAGADMARLSSLPRRLGLDDVVISSEEVRRGGFRGRLVTVSFDADSQPAARTLPEIEAIIDGGDVEPGVRIRAKEVFATLARAEARVHGSEVTAVHFHEVGAVDAICDIVGCCELFAELDLHELVCSPLPMGRGFVDGAHGRMPLPAPAVSEMLDGVPIYDAEVNGETVTPTGLALVRTFATRFGNLPALQVSRRGVGAGSRDTAQRANILRFFCGSPLAPLATREQQLMLLECNLDDMDPRLLPRVVTRLLDAGALEAYLTPVLMKKGRPGQLLSVLAEATASSALTDLMLRETTTLGVRSSSCERQSLGRKSERVETPYGEVEVKVAIHQGESLRCTPEYETCVRLADEKGVPLAEVLAAAEHAWRSRQ